MTRTALGAKWTSNRIIIGLGLLLAPIICLMLIPNRMDQASYIDDYFYTSYMVNLRHLIERYDLTYYLMRMAVIMPGRLIYHAFGPTAGFLVLHYCQILGGSTSLFLIARRYYGATIACLTTLFLLCSPWYLRAVTWDYVDGFAINYILAGFAFLLVPRRRVVGFFFAGACFALATNSHLYTVVIWLPFLLSWLIIEGRCKWSDLVRFAAALATGFVAAYLVLAVLLESVRPGLGLFFESFTLKYAAGLMKSGSQTWHQALLEFILAGNYYILIPLAMLVAAFLALLFSPKGRFGSDRNRLTVGFLLYLALVICANLLNQSMAAGACVTSFWCFSYLFIPYQLLLMAIIGEFAEHSTRSGMLTKIGIAICFAIWVACCYGDGYRFVNGTVLILLILVSFVAITLGARLPTLGLCSAVLLGIMVPVFFLQSASQYQELADRKEAALERDVFGGALSLIHVVESSLPPNAGRVQFWYAEQPGLHWLLVSLQSTYLYAYSRLPGEPPAVSPAFLQALTPDSDLVILGLSRSEVKRDVAATYRAGLRARLIDLSSYSGEVWSYSYAILRPEKSVPRQGALLSTLPLSALRVASSQAVISAMTSDAVSFESDPRQWAYSVEMPSTRLPLTNSESVQICVTAKVLAGELGVAITAKTDYSKLISEVPISQKDGTATVCNNAEVKNVGKLVVRNLSSAGKSSGIIKRIDVYRMATNSSR